MNHDQGSTLDRYIAAASKEEFLRQDQAASLLKVSERRRLAPQGWRAAVPKAPSLRALLSLRTPAWAEANTRTSSSIHASEDPEISEL